MGSCLGPAFGFIGGALQLGVWTEGEDKKPDDSGSCYVTKSNAGAWTLYAEAGHKTDSVSCQAICLRASIERAPR